MLLSPKIAQQKIAHDCKLPLVGGSCHIHGPTGFQPFCLRADVLVFIKILFVGYLLCCCIYIELTWKLLFVNRKRCSLKMWENRILENTLQKTWWCWWCGYCCSLLWLHHWSVRPHSWWLFTCWWWCVWAALIWPLSCSSLVSSDLCGCVACKLCFLLTTLVVQVEHSTQDPDNTFLTKWFLT